MPQESNVHPEFGRVFCIGFLFANNLEDVALILKDRPAYQAGLWNGIGGKLESSELRITKLSGTHRAALAQSREFKEETGVLIPSHKWEPLGEMVGSWG